jgi:hypothetical protein
MKYSDVTFKKQTYMGDVAYFFDLTPQYHGYTRDFTMFHVYDENTNSYISYNKTEFEKFLIYLENPSMQIVSNNGNNNGNGALNLFGYNIPPVVALIGLVVIIILIAKA